MAVRLLALVLTLLAGPLAAQDWADGAPSTPRFGQCLPEQMEAFETRLMGLPGYGVTVPLDALNVHWVQHCGYLAMGICQDSNNSLICQRRLRDAFAARAADMRGHLPDPEEVAGLALSPLYGRVWALAHGTNAGDDCAGWDYRRMLWCRSFQEALAFENAVWAWQVARLMGVAGPLDWEALSDLDIRDEG
ncbi:hypothetical protein [Hasllibacter sp. MH4015]|uniref:hypothetical protein n=1 Tax=Hasllibacter sp. MH4015 TaxID=2854029 RepID=UPI001CD2FAB0|nr:hypothetical protein [Hasllibacter sp. MH4015]